MVPLWPGAIAIIEPLSERDRVADSTSLELAFALEERRRFGTGVLANKERADGLRIALLLIGW